MKILLTLLLIFNTLHAFKSEKEIQIGTHTFNLVKESYNEYDNKGVNMYLYAKDANKSALPHFTFTLSYQFGSCSPLSLEVGTYKIEEETITTYSHWERYTNDKAPIGNRIQVYKLDTNGSFQLSSSRLYIERTIQNENADEGMQYLSSEPKTQSEKQLLEAYIASVEQLFKAKFVRGDEIKVLAKEVDEALELKRRQQWK